MISCVMSGRTEDREVKYRLSDSLGYNPGDGREDDNLRRIGRWAAGIADNSGYFSSNGSKDKGEVVEVSYMAHLMDGGRREIKVAFKQFDEKGRPEVWDPEWGGELSSSANGNSTSDSRSLNSSRKRRGGSKLIRHSG